jgi:hypothetical protein
VAPLRPFICVLVAVAVTFASVVAAFASTAKFAPQMDHPSMAGEATHMVDCDRLKPAHTGDHPECDQDRGCAGDFCMAKCFKIFASQRPRAARLDVPLLLQPFRSEYQDIWVDQPPAAPPRL